MMRASTVDVIITCYNDEQSILDAMISVKEQAQNLIERVHVIDNSSNDDSWRIIKQFCDSEEKFHCYIQEKPGAPAARNMGIERSSAEFVAFLDGDDFWMPNKIERQLSFMIGRQSQFSFTDVIIKDQCRETIFHCSDLPKGREPQTRHLLRFSPAIFPSTMMLRRSLLDKIGGFDEEFLKAQDTLFCLNASLYAQMDRLSEPLTIRRLHDGSLGAGYEMKRAYLYRVVSQFLSAEPQFEDVRSDAIFSIDMHFLRRAIGNLQVYSRISILRTILRHVHRRSMYPLLIRVLLNRS